MNKVLAWGGKVSPEFRARVFRISADMGWPDMNGMDSSKLMACMKFESGLDPAARNRAGSSATGLIQFMANTAEALGTTTATLAAMSGEHQLDFVYKYLSQWKKLTNRVPLLSDIYMSILLPSHIGEPDDSVLFSSGIAYTQNQGLDSNHDSQVTKGEAAAKAQFQLGLGYVTSNSWVGEV